MNTVIKGGIKYNLDLKREPGYEAEKNDCTVRALCNATGVPYRDAHRRLALEGRQHGHGMKFESVIAQWALAKTILFGYRISKVEFKTSSKSTIRRTNLGWSHRMVTVRPTLSQMLRECRAGRYIVVKRGHAFTIIDGVIHDSTPVGARSQVRSIYRFEPSSVVEAREAK